MILPVVASVCTEHPRARGENDLLLKHFWREEGTSPRTRGKQPYFYRTRKVGGNIPAHAGKTTGSSPGYGSMGEHPRARGENLGFVNIPRGDAGTSPRTRGKLAFFQDFYRNRRNIPAHAGKTVTEQQRNSELREHPRARGENNNCQPLI